MNKDDRPLAPRITASRAVQMFGGSVLYGAATGALNIAWGITVFFAGVLCVWLYLRWLGEDIIEHERGGE